MVHSFFFPCEMLTTTREKREMQCSLEEKEKRKGESSHVKPCTTVSSKLINPRPMTFAKT